MPTPCHASLDRYARSFYRAVKMAVRDFLDSESANRQKNRELIAKLGFCDSDILRLISAQRRLSQFCFSEAKFGEEAKRDDRGRNRANVWEVANALHVWRRQLLYHVGFYKYWQEARNNAPADAERKRLRLSADHFS